MKTVTLRDDELRTVVLALSAVAPSGGSSHFLALAMKLSDHFGIDIDDRDVFAVQARAAADLHDAMNGLGIVALPVETLDGRA